MKKLLEILSLPLQAARALADRMSGAACSWKPKDDRPAGLKWVWMDEDGWREVCDFCNGNCGQCGISRRVGNVPAPLEAIITNGGWDKGSPAGFNSPGARAALARRIGLL